MNYHSVTLQLHYFSVFALPYCPKSLSTIVHDTGRSRTQEAQSVTTLHTLEQKQSKGVNYAVCEFEIKWVTKMAVNW